MHDSWPDVRPGARWPKPPCNFFTHTPKLPGAELTALPVLGLMAIAVALVAAGLGSFRRRDLALPT